MTRLFCHTPRCSGEDGVWVPTTPAAELEPPELAWDTCRSCGGDLHDEPRPDDIDEDEEGEELQDAPPPPRDIDLEFPPHEIPAWLGGSE